MDSIIKDLIVLIPLRGGSKGIKRKNLKLFRRYPLFTWVTRAALNANLNVVISTEDKEIKDSIKRYFPLVKIQDRPEHLAEDNSSTEEVISYFLEEFTCEHIMLLQATSPLTSTEDIISSIELYLSSNCRPLVSGTRQFDFVWKDNGYPFNYDPLFRPRRQDWEGSFVENGAIYIFQAKDFKNNISRCKPPCTLFEMSPNKSLELDSQSDWKILEEM